MDTSKIVAALRPALWTALFTFAGIFLGSLTGWLSALAENLSDFADGGEFVLPDPSVLVKAIVAGTAAAFAGLANFAVRYVQSVTGKGVVPEYHRADTE